MPTAVVIHGANNRNEAEFRAGVDRLANQLGQGWVLHPIWWGTAAVDLDLVRSGLAATFPPAPDNFWEINDGDGPTIGEAERQDEVRAEGGAPFYANAIWHGRRFALENFTGISADVFLYWHATDAILDQVHKSIRDAVGDSGGVNVISHSLGAIIAVDLAARAMLSIDRLVTYGTQISIAHVLDPTRNPGLQPYRPPQSVLVPGIETWTNLWNKYDPIAFAMSNVFRVSSGSVNDIEVPLNEDVPVTRAHSAYLQSERVIEAIRGALG